jgi:hypothetical protein
VHWFLSMFCHRSINKTIEERVKQMAARKKRGGRPLKHSGEGRKFEMLPELGRAPLSKTRAFRVRPGLDKLLQTAAAKASRTLSQEIEHRVEKSFADERIAQAHFGSDVGAELLRMFYSALALEGIHPDWTGDPVRAENFRVAVNGIIAGLLDLPFELPLPEQWAEGVETARQYLRRSSKRPEIRFAHFDPTADGDPYKPLAGEEPTTSKRRKVGT